MGIFIGLLMAGAGFLLIWKSEWILENFGRVAWAEEHLLADGGSRLFYKLLGLGLIILGFMTMTGILKSIGLALLPRFFMGLKPSVPPS